LKRQDGGDRGELDFPLDAASDDGRRRRIVSRQELCRHRSSGARRNVVMLAESITASGVPLVASASTTVPWMVGSANRCALFVKFPLIFAAK
jgi:hypothetical protein